MRSFLLLCLLLGLPAWLRAQDSTQYIRPYLFQLGGTVSAFNQVDRLQNNPSGPAPVSSLGFELAPSISYVFSPSYSLGAEVLLNYSLQENNVISTQTGILSKVRQEAVTFTGLPEFTLYLPIVERVYGYFQGAPGYSAGTRTALQVDPVSNLVLRRIDYNAHGFVGQAGVGLLYFVRETIAFNLQGNYRFAYENLSYIGDPLSSTDLLPAPGFYMRQGLRLRLGLNVYFQVKHAAPIRSAETKATRRAQRKAEAKKLELKRLEELRAAEKKKAEEKKVEEKKVEDKKP